MLENGAYTRSQVEYIQLKSMLRGACELAESFEKYSLESSNPTVRDEFQKLTATARNHVYEISELLGERNEQ
jgi:hypothetical protein